MNIRCLSIIAVPFDGTPFEALWMICKLLSRRKCREIYVDQKSFPYSVSTKIHFTRRKFAFSSSTRIHFTRRRESPSLEQNSHSRYNYFCNSRFSAAAVIKSKYRSKINVKQEIIVAVSSLIPSVLKMCGSIQAHHSLWHFPYNIFLWIISISTYIWLFSFLCLVTSEM